MTRLLVWLYRHIQRILIQRGALPDWSPPPTLELPVWADAPRVPDGGFEAIHRVKPLPQAPPAVFPETPNGERYVVWTRGSVDTITNDGREAARAWERVTKRAGVHRFWDREHRTGHPVGLRSERRIPIG